MLRNQLKLKQKKLDGGIIKSNCIKISVSLLCPGVVDTPLTNKNNDSKPDWLRPETVAESALHIATAPSNVNIFNLTLFGTEEKPFGK